MFVSIIGANLWRKPLNHVTFNYKYNIEQPHIIVSKDSERLLAVKGAGPLKVKQGGAIHSNRVLTISQSLRFIFMARLHSSLLCRAFCSRSQVIFLELSSNKKLSIHAPTEAETSSSQDLPLQSVTHLFARLLITSSAPVCQKAVCAPV